MPKKTYSEYLISKEPRLLDLSKYYESLGLSEPVLWAKDELNGEPTVATAALVYAFRQEVIEPTNHSWIEQILSGNANVENEEIAANAIEALAKLKGFNVPLEILTPIARCVQAQTINNIAGLLEEGPAICCIPMPTDREANWQMFAVDSEDQPTKPILAIAHMVRT